MSAPEVILPFDLLTGYRTLSVGIFIENYSINFHLAGNSHVEEAENLFFLEIVNPQREEFGSNATQQKALTCVMPDRIV